MSRKPKHHLTEQQIREILFAWITRPTRKTLAEKYGVSTYTIDRVTRGTAKASR